MAKIELSEPDGPYHCEIDTDAMQVTIRKVFLGVKFVSDSGETLSVSMRDSGFEVRYFDGSTQPSLIEFKEGHVGNWMAT